MAEARSAVTEPLVKDLEEGRDTTQDFIRAWRKAFFRRFFRFRNQVRNGMWPTAWWNLVITTGVFSILLVGDWSWASPINSRLWYITRLLHLNEGVPFFLRVIVGSLLGGILFFIILLYKRRWLLRVLLSYRGWLYEPLRNVSLRTKVWGLVVRLVSGYQPATYSCQKSLPFLPVPDLKETLDKFLTSIEPLYGKDSDTYNKFKLQADEFRAGLGAKLQRILVLKSWWAQNWVTDWWEKYIYLMGRTPIAINSNYYILDHGYWQPTHRQVSRASNAIYSYMVAKRNIDHETLPPLVLRGTIPLCMAQYERVFSVTRIPGEDCDELVKYKSSESKHIMIMRKGLYYKLDVYDTAGNVLTPQTLEKQLEFIIQDADKHEDEYTSAAKSISALTGIERTEWARARINYFGSGINKESLHTLESAIFHMVLEHRSYETYNERAKFLLHGDGKTIWYDKSFNLIIFSDGKSGLNAEHSWGDAPVVGHIGEFHLTNELLDHRGILHYRFPKPWEFKPGSNGVLDKLYDEEGYCTPIPDAPQSSVKTPERLIWDLPEALESKIGRAISFNQTNNEDLDLVIIDHKAYGKGFIKTCKVSPDAYVQVALQLAYFKDAGKVALTYEASMTRLYLNGRTETVRSLTNGCYAFVCSMMEKTMKPEERIKLLREACDSHQQLYRDAMAGKGIDRHLFGLYIACKGLGYESEFLKSALTIPWTLSTSQQPQQQIANSPNCSDPKYEDKVCPGGGFGPVSDQGYGVSYMLPGDHRLFFHVSSKRSANTTNSQRFVNHLIDSLREMRELFEPVTDSKEVPAGKPDTAVQASTSSQ